ncbi:MAG: DUF1958 domain-containing protein, partial [Enterococcus gilvus]
KQVVVANQKEQAAETMPKLVQSYKEAKTESESLPDTKQSASPLSKMMKVLPPVVLFLLGLLLLVFPTKRNVTGKTRRSTRKRGRTMVKAAGAVCILGALVLLVWLFL